MLRIMPVLMVGAALIFFLFSSSGRRPPADSSTPRISEAATVLHAVSTQAPPSPTLDSLSLLASLPTLREELREWVSDWCRLESAILGREPKFLEGLLTRYESEVDRGYKGLLAVLLSADPRTHPRILGDQQSLPKDGWDVFHGMALLALVRNPPETAEDAVAPQRVIWWERLFRFVDIGTIVLEGRIEDRMTGQFQKRLACSVSMGHMSDCFDIARECLPVALPELRAALMDAFLTKWDWDFPHWLSLEVIQKTAETDSTLARTLAETYLGSASEESAEQGLRLLRDTVLPDDAFPLLEKWARIAMDGWVIRNAIDVLGNQKSGAAERMLVEMHAARPKYREEILEAMAKHGAASFQPIAEAELQSGESVTRVAALRILARMPTTEAWNLILQTGLTDTLAKVRYEVLAILKERNVWNRQENQVLAALVSDSNDWVRNLAQGLHDAKDKSTISVRRYSNWDWSYYHKED